MDYRYDGGITAFSPSSQLRTLRPPPAVVGVLPYATYLYLVLVRGAGNQGCLIMCNLTAQHTEAVAG